MKKGDNVWLMVLWLSSVPSFLFYRSLIVTDSLGRLHLMVCGGLMVVVIEWLVAFPGSGPVLKSFLLHVSPLNESSLELRSLCAG